MGFTLDYTGTQIDALLAKLASLGDAAGLPVFTAAGGALGTKTAAAARAALSAAPDGYGLGTAVPAVCVDADNAVNNGWYRSLDAANVPYPYGVIHVTAYSPVWVVQDYYAMYMDYTLIHLVRIKAGTWSPWEYVNPPMALGVEYRTTERYLGKPVYAKVVNCGAMPDASAKSVAHGIDAIMYALSCACSLRTGSGATMTTPRILSDSLFNVYADGVNIYLYTTVAASALNAYVTLRYTKTTD